MIKNWLGLMLMKFVFWAEMKDRQNTDKKLKKLIELKRNNLN